MDTTTTTGQPLVDPSQEVWGARLTSYLSVMGMVILQYDCLLTLKDEVCLLDRTSGHPPHNISFNSADATCLAGRALRPKSPLLH